MSDFDVIQFSKNRRLAQKFSQAGGETASRRDCKMLIARQCALAQGQQFDTLDHKQRVIYFTLADSILATVERKSDVRWR